MALSQALPQLRFVLRIAAIATGAALVAAVFVAQNAHPVWADGSPGGITGGELDPGGTPLVQSPFTPAILHTPSGDIQVVVFEGNFEDALSSDTTTLSGFTVPAAPFQATTTYVVADGQCGDNGSPPEPCFDGRPTSGSSTETLTFNLLTKGPDAFRGHDPCPWGPDTCLWDTRTEDVSSFVSSGDTTAKVTITAGSDCVNHEAQVFAVGPPAAFLSAGYAAAGIGLRNQDTGTINLAGIPAGSVIKQALLYWNILADDQPRGDIKVNGSAASGVMIGQGVVPCWDAKASFAFRADVTSLVTGSGAYVISGFPTGTNSGDNPWDNPTPQPMMEGASIVVLFEPKRETTLTYTGDTSGVYHDPTTLSATLTSEGSPLAGATINFAMGAQTCSGVTDALGSASCSFVINQVPAVYTLTADYAGDATHLPSNFTGTYTVAKEDTTTTYTGPTLLANGSTVTLSGVLLEDGTTPIAGRVLTFTIGSGITAQSCSGITDALGFASCSLVVNQPLGPGAVIATFAGDAFYLPSSDTKPTIVFAGPAAGGFVVGDQSATGQVEFWGAQWAKDNSLSGGSAPSSFKGFENSGSVTCGGTWTTDPGNSSGPPSSVPTFMAVIVSSSITKSGSTISGDVKAIVIVQTDPGYAGNPGHAGTGTVVAVVCST